MHRIVSFPGDEGTPKNLTIIEQPNAPVLFLSSANTDISTLSEFLKTKSAEKWRGQIKALPLETLSHPSQIDHYLNKTAKATKVIIVRLLGGKGHWSYGLQELTKWKSQDKNRKIIILAGIDENTEELNTISNIDYEITRLLGKLLRVGGINNIK